ncbi:MAG: hypothetical protein AB7S75_01120 [Desulfococcaceae bacterium]
MTNYEKLFQEQMKNPEFAKFYFEAGTERMLSELPDNLKQKISDNEPKEILLKAVESIQGRIKDNMHLQSL